MERPFIWFPLAGERHAVYRKDRHVPVGEQMRCLCGATHPRGAAGAVESLWPTCGPCWAKACEVAGLQCE